MLHSESVTADAKGRIIGHAISLFRTSGFARVSVEEITSGLGMSKKTFYKHFASKEDLVRQIVERLVGETSTHLHAIVNADQPFVTKLQRMIIFINAQFRRITAPLLRDLQVHAPASWHYIQEFRRKNIIAVWGGMVEQGKREGYIRPEINSRLFVLSLLGIIESVIDPDTLANESFSTDEALSGIIEILLRGILTDNVALKISTLHLTE